MQKSANSQAASNLRLGKAPLSQPGERGDMSMVYALIIATYQMPVETGIWPETSATQEPQRMQNSQIVDYVPI